MGTPEMQSFDGQDQVYEMDSLAKLRTDLFEDIRLIEEQLADPTNRPDNIRELQTQKAELMEQYRATDPNNSINHK